MNDRQFLKEGLEQLQLQVTDTQVEQFMKLQQLLVEWNQKVNLTAITELREVIIKHYFDSATCFNTGLILPESSVIDIGTGAGFPGVPIKIISPNTRVTLLDSLNKRIHYLNDVIDQLQLKQIETIHARAEEGGADVRYREHYDVVVSRAVAACNILLEYCVPYVKMGGVFLCQKGPSYEAELKDADQAMRTLGVELEKIEQCTLPFSDITHTILIFRKIGQTPSKYPRKPGKPLSNPIK